MIALVIFKRFISHRNKGNTNQENTTCKRSLAYRYYNQYFARNRCFYEIIEWLSTRISKGSKGAKDFLGMQEIDGMHNGTCFSLTGSYFNFTSIHKAP